jgi:hypothetical protein
MQQVGVGRVLAKVVETREVSNCGLSLMLVLRTAGDRSEVLNEWKELNIRGWKFGVGAPFSHEH